jgi:hypothetical protein
MAASVAVGTREDEVTVDAPSRAPDRVTYTEWERDNDDPEPDRRLVPVYARPWPFELLHYREMVERRWRRKRLEMWIVPAQTVPVYDAASATFAAKQEPEQRIGRWEWEYRR